LSYLQNKNGAKILDAGCGRGFYMKALDQMLENAEICGCELNKEYIGELKKYNSIKNKITIKNASINKIPYPDKYFDFIICSEVLEHVPDDIGALGELTRVLKDNGNMLVTVPAKNYPFLWDPLNFILERLFRWHVPSRIHWLAGIWADHLRLYKIEEIEKKVVDTGLVIEKKQTATYISLPFIHFLLYGVGKNIIKYKLATNDFNRFNLDAKESLLLKIVRLPIYFFDGFNKYINNPKRYLNIMMIIKKHN